MKYLVIGFLFLVQACVTQNTEVPETEPTEQTAALSWCVESVEDEYKNIIANYPVFALYINGTDAETFMWFFNDAEPKSNYDFDELIFITDQATKTTHPEKKMRVMFFKDKCMIPEKHDHLFPFAYIDNILRQALGNKT